MQGLEFARAYIDDLLVLTTGKFEEHLSHLEQVLTRLSEAGLKVNAVKSFFGRTELEYLGYWITQNGVKPLNKKVEAITNLAPPTTRKAVRRIIGLVNYYRDMWKQRSHILSPLTALTSVKVPWRWTDIEQKAFEKIKKVIARHTILAYPDFDKPFEIHTDASAYQLGACISQDKKPIAFYSRKLTPAQTRYTTTERELLSIVETLKMFRTILMGQQLIVHTDHENLTYKHFNSDRVMRWRLFIEEYSPDLRYIKGEKNIVADAMSRLEMLDTPMDKADFTEALRAKFYGFEDDDLPDTAFPLSYALLGKAQSTDKAILLELKKSNSHYTNEPFTGSGKTRELVCYNGKIVVPSSMQKQVV